MVIVRYESRSETLICCLFDVLCKYKVLLEIYFVCVNVIDKELTTGISRLICFIYKYSAYCLIYSCEILLYYLAEISQTYKTQPSSRILYFV